MTQAQLLADFKRTFEYDFDGTVGPDSTDADLLRALDRGVIDLARNNPLREMLLPVTLSAGQNVVDLSDPALTGGRVVFRVRSVRIGGQITQTQLGHVGLMTFDMFESLYPNWQVVSPGDVVDLSATSPTTVVFYPPPSAAFLTGKAVTIDADVAPKLPSFLLPDERLSFPEDLAPHVVAASIYLACNLMTMRADQRQAIQLAYVDAQRATNRAIVGKMANRSNSRDPRAAGRFQPKIVEI